MTFFIGMLTICVLFLIASIILGLKNRSMLLSVGCAIFSIIGTLFTLFTSIPAPTIYPLDNEARIYNETAKVDIESYPIFTVYYSLDGSDPKDGNIYTGSFTITETTTVVARNRFLYFFWSEPYPNTFRFENAQATTITYVNENIDFQTIRQVLLLSILAIALFYEAIKKLRELFRL